jgi:hypothetical protein
MSGALIAEDTRGRSLLPPLGRVKTAVCQRARVCCPLWLAQLGQGSLPLERG